MNAKTLVTSIAFLNSILGLLALPALADSPTLFQYNKCERTNDVLHQSETQKLSIGCEFYLYPNDLPDNDASFSFTVNTLQSLNLIGKLVREDNNSKVYALSTFTISNRGGSIYDPDYSPKPITGNCSISEDLFYCNYIFEGGQRQRIKMLKKRTSRLSPDF
jgi:hypothetical protein